MIDNTMQNKLAGVCALVLLAACSGQESEFADALRDNTNMPPGIADCIAELAEEELSEDARSFLVASMQEDDARVAEMRGTLPMSEMASAGMFMVSASTRCGAPIE